MAQNAVDSSWRPYAEDRFKAIYDRSKFRAKTLRPTWQSDSSGFYLEEEDPQTKQSTRWFFDSKTGERRSASAEKRLPSTNDPGPEKQLPRLVSRDAKLIAIDPNTKQEKVLVSAEPSRSIDYRQLSWSPDGKHILFVQADYTDVRQRWVLVPGDPSYPGVQQNRFARVGETIEQLRIGLVNAEGEQLKWLPIETPKEGMYLGQVEWTGNANEILVEKFSRFRDKREFLLANVDGKVQSIYSESNDAWVESSQGKNSGLVWIQGGNEFLVISEKDGWRHAYRYARDGKQLSLLTPGDYDIIDRAAVDEKGGWYYFYASPKNATQKYLYRVPLDGSGKMQRVTPEDQIGTHAYQFSPDFHWAIHTRSTLNSPPIKSSKWKRIA
ncbi:MAG: DPP IV N-terminal domain-containing protein [Pirellulales bacterium]